MQIYYLDLVLTGVLVIRYIIVKTSKNTHQICYHYIRFMFERCAQLTLAHRERPCIWTTEKGLASGPQRRASDSGLVHRDEKGIASGPQPQRLWRPTNYMQGLGLTIEKGLPLATEGPHAWLQTTEKGLLTDHGGEWLAPELKEGPSTSTWPQRRPLYKKTSHLATERGLCSREGLRLATENLPVTFEKIPIFDG